MTTAEEPDGLTAGLGLLVLIGLSSSLLSDATGVGSSKYSMDECWRVWLVGHVIGISSMVVVNEGGMMGAVGWTFAGRVIVTEKGVGMTGGYKKFVDPGPGS